MRVRHRVATVVYPSSRRSCTSRDLHVLHPQFLAGDDARRAAAGAAAERRRQSIRSPPQSRHTARPGVSRISSSAPSTTVPWRRHRNRSAARPAAPRQAGRSPPARAGTRAPAARSAQISTTAVARLSSCMSADPRQLFADQHVDDAFAAERGLHHHHAGRFARHLADDRRVRSGRMRTHRGQHAIGIGRRQPPRPACPRSPGTADRDRGFRRRRAPPRASAGASRGCGCRRRKLLREFVQHRGDAAARRIAQAVVGGQSRQHGGHQSVQRLAVALDIGLQRRAGCARSGWPRHGRPAPPLTMTASPGRALAAEIATPRGDDADARRC